MPRRPAFGKNWWSQRWIAALENFGWGSRLERGRAYASGGRVRSIDVLGSAVKARVQGSRSSPYRVSIILSPLKPEEWESVLDALSTQALFAAKLLAGEMPQDVEDAFHEVGVSLFPSASGDIGTECSCPDWANPCKHVAAVHYVLSEELDRDPFLLFALRGRSKEDVLDALRSRRSQLAEQSGPTEAQGDAGTPEGEAPADLSSTLDRFWSLDGDIDALVESPGRRKPLAEGALRVLGHPAFSREGEAIFSALIAAYDRISTRARRAARPS